MTFDLQASLDAKTRGQDRAADNKASLLAYARKVAAKLAIEKGIDVTADDVQRELENRGISIRALGNAAGSLFKGRDWKWTGEFVQSEREHAHGNLLRKWRYVGKREVEAMDRPRVVAEKGQARLF